MNIILFKMDRWTRENRTQSCYMTCRFYVEDRQYQILNVFTSNLWLLIVTHWLCMLSQELLLANTQRITHTFWICGWEKITIFFSNLTICHLFFKIPKFKFLFESLLALIGNLIFFKVMMNMNRKIEPDVHIMS